MKEKYEYIKAGLWANLQYFFKWTLLSCGIGVMGGGVGSLLGLGVDSSANFGGGHIYRLRELGESK